MTFYLTLKWHFPRTFERNVKYQFHFQGFFSSCSSNSYCCYFVYLGKGYWFLIIYFHLFASFFEKNLLKFGIQFPFEYIQNKNGKFCVSIHEQKGISESETYFLFIARIRDGCDLQLFELPLKILPLFNASFDTPILNHDLQTMISVFQDWNAFKQDANSSWLTKTKPSFSIVMLILF